MSYPQEVQPTGSTSGWASYSPRLIRIVHAACIESRKAPNQPIHRSECVVRIALHIRIAQRRDTACLVLFAHATHKGSNPAEPYCRRRVSPSPLVVRLARACVEQFLPLTHPTRRIEARGTFRLPMVSFTLAGTFEWRRARDSFTGDRDTLPSA